MECSVCSGVGGAKCVWGIIALAKGGGQEPIGNRSRRSTRSSKETGFFHRRGGGNARFGKGEFRESEFPGSGLDR